MSDENKARLGELLRRALESADPNAFVGATEIAAVDGRFNLGLVAAKLVEAAAAEKLL